MLQGLQFVVIALLQLTHRQNCSTCLDPGVHLFDAYQGPYSQLCLEQGVIQAQQEAAVDHVVHELLPVLAEAESINPIAHVVHCVQESQHKAIIGGTQAQRVSFERLDF